ncbi:hypothetical protein PsorP6_004964 [Peronosclerospora sorghi]|uniref:Uncharacterized protein n=1 Tax=Peronosclerospora sorghi TaxID=230839 RepID=A0ACC0W897_9STRA|nr:hypothetical protein PsorP6_004964 [Peronosclerospora sorghi]
MAAAPSANELVPLCTLSDERHLQLHDEGVNFLHGSKLSTRKLALVGVFHVSEDDQDGGVASPRGVFLSSHTVSIVDQNVTMVILVLRGVSLVQEPFWGSLLFILSSHVVVVKAGAISTASFQEALPFLTHFAQLQVDETIVDEEENATLLQELAPRLTWAAVDLQLKDMRGCDSACSYLEHQLATGATDAHLRLRTFVPAYDCIVLKSSSFQVQSESHTSSKLLTHVAAHLECKSLFGCYLNGCLAVQLIRSLTHVMAAPEGASVVIQRVATNVFTAYWHQLVHQAFKTYGGFFYARLKVYERVRFTADYLVDVTERKLEANTSQTKHHVARAHAREPNTSMFDEFGNLIKQQHSDSDDGSAVTPPVTLNTGLFSFLKNRAGHALSKQLSRLSTTRWSSSIRSTSQGAIHNGTNSLNDIQEDIEAAQAELEQEPRVSVDELLAQCAASIARFAMSSQEFKTPSEAMPVHPAVLDTVHAEAVDQVNTILKPFLDLQSRVSSRVELTGLVDCHVGKKMLWTKMARVRERFARANQVASTIFCADLLQYLHSVVLKKSERDKEVHEQHEERRGRAVSSILLVDKTSGHAPVALTRVPLELLTYKTNLEAMISQYHFVARGPQSATVLVGFLHGPVRKQLTHLSHLEFHRFQCARDEHEARVHELDDGLKEKEQHLAALTAANAEWSRQEREAIAAIEHKFAEQMRSVQDAIDRMDTEIESAKAARHALYQSTMQATRHTIETVDQVTDKSRLVSGYLERYEKGHVFSSSWRQYFYVLTHARLTCYKSKSAFEERGRPCEEPISISGYTVVRSRTDELKLKLVPPGTGRPLLRFRAPASVGRETWMERFTQATQCDD